MLPKRLRIIALLAILVMVSVDQFSRHWHSTNWDTPLWVIIYPINGDGKSSTQRYIDSLTPKAFIDIDRFFSEQARLYQLSLQNPLETKLAPQISKLPPKLSLPAPWYHQLIWSLKIRYWASQFDSFQGVEPDIKIFVLYFDPESTPAVPHSVGLQKSKIGVVYAFASRSQEAQNAFVISHEFLHTVGASDKYSLQTGKVLIPDGLADPEQMPLFPQTRAEIMGGKVVISEHKSIIPEGLNQVIIGPKTAKEIHWIE